MGDISIVAAQWPQVEVGRVLLINDGPNAGKLATIVEIIDHKRVRGKVPRICWCGGGSWKLP